MFTRTYTPKIFITSSRLNFEIVLHFYGVNFYVELNSSYPREKNFSKASPASLNFSLEFLIKVVLIKEHILFSLDLFIFQERDEFDFTIAECFTQITKELGKKWSHCLKIYLYSICCLENWKSKFWKRNLNFEIVIHSKMKSKWNYHFHFHEHLVCDVLLKSHATHILTRGGCRCLWMEI